MEIIRTESLSKSFSETVVVDGISLRVNHGEISGFLGLNGAGKTTTIRMLLGMIKPNQGNVFLFGKRVGSDSEIWKNVGYMVESPNSYPNLTVRENLKVVQCYRRVKGNFWGDQVMERLRLDKFSDKKAAELSMGNLQRLGLAKALLHRPQLLILDEPINGLDPAGIVEVREMLRELSNYGTTILLSSHILSEITKLATRIGIIHEGRMIDELIASDLEARLIKKFVLDTPNNKGAFEFLKQKGIKAAMNGGDKIEITDTSAFEHPEGVSELMVAAKFPPRELYRYTEDLESFFLRVINPNKA
jgi:ABC-2 type transport system ATP-binding protein